MDVWDAVFAFLVVSAIVGANHIYYEWRTGVPTFPTMPAVRRRIIDILKKDARSRSKTPYTIIDLGSGSGQITRRIARAMPEARVIGLEMSLVPWLRSVVRQKLFGPANLSYMRRDFLAFDISDADAVYTYLHGNIMEPVSEKLRRDLKPGALVLCNRFALRGDWTPVEVLTVPAPIWDYLKTTISVYRQA